MSRRTDSIGNFLFDLAIAVALSIIPAWVMSYGMMQDITPLGPLMIMVTHLFVHGWLVFATWHGRIALVVLLLLMFAIGRWVPAGWPRRIILLVLLMGWGAYVYLSPELLGDGVPA
jgi:ABC-type multidrug transport system permease subunit